MAVKRQTMIPKVVTGRILINSGAKRVSQEAMDLFTDILEEQAIEISEKAAKIARHAGRKTILDTDIKLAAGK